MSDFAHDYTDRELDALEKRITAHYKRAYEELSEKATDYFEQFKKRDAEQLALLNDGKITELQYQQWRLAQMGRGKRFEAMRDDAAERLTKANQIACDYINDTTPKIFAENRNYMAYGLEKEYGNVGFTLYDENMVKKLMAEEADFLPQPSINVPKDLWWNKKLITAEMTSGILQGESIGKLADRFMNVTDANRVSALRNARTFITGAENAGRYDGYKAADKLGIKGIRKQWLATLDNRTRHSHQELDGQIVGWDEKFESILGSKMRYPADKEGAKAGDLYNCRCTMITVEKSGIVAEDIKRRVGNEVIPDMTYKEWENWKKRLEKSGKNGIIKLEDIVIGRSIGAKAKNYDIQLPNREIVHLTEGTKITQVQVIAGKGRNRQIDEIDGLLIKYPQTKETEWKKEKGFGYVDYQGESFKAELHWYEEPSVGRVEWKVKPDGDGNWFYED